MLPENLVLVRHGESEFNKLVHELRRTNRDFNSLDPSILNKTGSKWRLTDLGLEQAKVAGDYIRNNMKIKFDGFFVSDYVRAKETAAALQLKNASWKVEPYLRERDWGMLACRILLSELVHQLLEKKTLFTVLHRMVNQFPICVYVLTGFWILYIVNTRVGMLLLCATVS